MRELITRLSLTDDNAANALRVIDYFDALVDGHAPLSAFVRGAAALADCTAGFEDRSRGTSMRFTAGGRPVEGDRPSGTPAGSAWVDQEAGVRVWLERDEGAFAVDPMILERWSAGVRVIHERTVDRGHLEPAVRLAIDEHADPEQRAAALRRLGVTRSSRVIAGIAIGAPEQTFPAQLRSRVGQVTAAIVPTESVADLLAGTAAATHWRIGIGGPAEATELPRSWSESLLALRLTADGSPGEPGELRLAYDDLGGLAVIAEAVSVDSANIADVQAISASFVIHPWTLITLEALARHASLRQAAQELHLHHSTLQERVTILRRDIGFAPDTPQGRVRTTLALTLRRLHHSGDLF